MFSNQIEMFMFMTIEYVNRSGAFKNLVYDFNSTNWSIIQFSMTKQACTFCAEVDSMFMNAMEIIELPKTDWNDDDFSEFHIFLTAQFA